MIKVSFDLKVRDKKQAVEIGGELLDWWFRRADKVPTDVIEIELHDYNTS